MRYGKGGVRESNRNDVVHTCRERGWEYIILKMVGGRRGPGRRVWDGMGWDGMRRVHTSYR